MTKAAPSGSERRKHKRRPVLDTFSMFIVVPKKGFHRLKVDDLSEAGIGFVLDIEGEAIADFPIKSDEKIDVRLYLNQSLYLPLQVQVARIEEKDSLRRIGAAFVDKNSKGFHAFSAFLAMLDGILDAALIETPTG
ncbi:MAG: PilZ domain-containing protein [Bdellovibrionota bacterium]